MFYLFILAGSSSLSGLFSSCREQGLLWVAVDQLLIAMASRCGAQAVGAEVSVVAACGFSSCGTRA